MWQVLSSQTDANDSGVEHKCVCCVSVSVRLLTPSPDRCPVAKHLIASSAKRTDCRNTTHTMVKRRQIIFSSVFFPLLSEFRESLSQHTAQTAAARHHDLWAVTLLRLVKACDLSCISLLNCGLTNRFRGVCCNTLSAEPLLIYYVFNWSADRKSCL